ncbi:DUF262 domain-containing protein [Elizabethkingia anophelis]|uniref:DUF262 domain-containing protein n=1 Tax=Elizabethkingia anophelis TaxID=1117645 RepID=UPI00193BFF53|nr:DUF262 domain-containing protein [Elizabethkingia anophelis]QRI48306.1 DUF262 domain-containing protein [Elizabethkingia anophelis]
MTTTEQAKYKGEIISFHELLNNQKIEIPIIQRDYAQGRLGERKIRITFLNALLNSLKHEEQIMLDFIYGSSTDEAFQPLDGQQRLTTLFLLHWYAATKDSFLESISDKLIKFTYETRISSREFCNALVNHSINLEKEIPPSEKIKDSSWFFLSWKNDPTIDAMLRTLDDIHEMFFELENLWNDLISDEKKLIRFYYVNLEHIGLTDDLYIKMNARGKLLTPFENFKASFEKLIRDERWEPDNEISFANKIDGDWTDLFWKYFRKNKSIDNAFIRFISSIVMIRQSLERSKKIEDRATLISKLQEDPNLVSAKMFEKNDFTYLVECLDLLKNKFSNIRKSLLTFPLFRHKPKDNFFNQVLVEEEGASYTQKVLLYAQMEYFREVDSYDELKYNEWMRVVRNIVSQGDIEKSGKRADIVRSPQTFDGIIFLISELSQGASDIYEYLASSPNIKSTSAKEQIEEEKLKAKLILNNPLRKDIIHQLEDTDLLRGKINFIFYCIDFNGDIETFNDELFIRIKDIFINNISEESSLSNDLRRALLTIAVDGKFEFYNYWWSLWNVVGGEKRRLIDKYREIEYLINSTEYRDYFKNLLISLMSNNLIGIINSFIPPTDFPNWKTRLIKEPALLDKQSISNYIAISSDNSCCYLLKSKRPRDINGCIKIE